MVMRMTVISLVSRVSTLLRWLLYLEVCSRLLQTRRILCVDTCCLPTCKAVQVRDLSVTVAIQKAETLTFNFNVCLSFWCIRKFCKCSQRVKICFFRAFYINFYGISLWRRYNSTVLLCCMNWKLLMLNVQKCFLVQICVARSKIC
jgi:hypothetical protein